MSRFTCPKGLKSFLVISACALTGFTASQALPGGQSRAQAMLYFPPARKTDYMEREAQGELVYTEPRDWAQSVLHSTGLGEAVRSQLPDETPLEVISASNLLLEESRMRVTQREPGLLIIQVLADKNETALLLCQGIVAYLHSQLQATRDQSLQSKASSQSQNLADVLERGERAEKELVEHVLQDSTQREKPKERLNMFPFYSREPVDYSTREDFLTGLRASRRLKATDLYLALQQETRLPGFTVIESAQALPPLAPAWYSLLGSALGSTLGCLLAIRLRRECKA